MISGLRGAFLLMVCLVFFMAIIGLFALSTVMQPSRWSERPRLN
jgi:hypothetical protein